MCFCEKLLVTAPKNPFYNWYIARLHCFILWVWGVFMLEWVIDVKFWLSVLLMDKHQLTRVNFYILTSLNFLWGDVIRVYWLWIITKTKGDRAFTTVRLWNSLHLSIRSESLTQFSVLVFCWEALSDIYLERCYRNNIQITLT